MLQVQWSEIKTLIDAGSVEYRHVELSNKYIVVAFDEHFKMQCSFFKGDSEAVEYEASYKAGGNKVVGVHAKTPLGLPLVAIKKPDGASKTVISHNFCDSSTWPNPTDSTWEIIPPAGSRYLLQKAEVQFTHDVQLKTLTPTPGEIRSKIYYEGFAIPEHEKVFKSLMDVFDLGNKHYSMNAEVDGMPGVTTVVFDYTDSISLESIVNMKMTFELLNHTEIGGTACTVSLIVTPEEY